MPLEDVGSRAKSCRLHCMGRGGSAKIGGGLGLGECREESAVYGQWETGRLGWPGVMGPLGRVTMRNPAVKPQCGYRQEGATADSRARA